tara:strand:- start:1325 stop:2275 length:951 start_codon:yes stop_codon:yes gene_type:complete
VKKRNVFIFGDSGFIGTHLKKSLLKKENINLSTSRYKSKKRNNNENYYKKFWPRIIENSDVIVYLSFNNNLEDLKKNFSASFFQNLMPLYILNNLIKKKRKNVKLIYTSTASLYGNNVKLPAKETSQIEINNIYEYLKFASEQILIDSKNKHLNYQILRLSNVYGENISKLKQNNRQVLTRVINDAYLYKKIMVFGNGNYFRDFVHVDDVCNAMYKIICKNKINSGIYNIGSGKKIKLIDIFKKIRNLLLKNYNYLIRIEKIKFKRTRNKSDIRNFQACISKSNSKFLWKPKVPFEKGLNNLVKHVFSKRNKKYKT